MKFFIVFLGVLFGVHGAWANQLITPAPGFPARPQQMPVFVMGPTLTAADCQAAVNSAVWTQCSLRNNCRGLLLADIRPAVMMELANRVDHNFATQCQGFIDTAFRDYLERFAGAAPTMVAFPSVGGPMVAHASFPPAMTDAQMRQMQLQQMQAMNAPQAQLMPAAFPTTFQDLSFVERVEITQQGWQDAYDRGLVGQVEMFQTLTIESDEDAQARRDREATARRQRELYEQQHAQRLEFNRDSADFCNRNPYHELCAIWRQARQEANRQQATPAANAGAATPPAASDMDIVIDLTRRR